jgi:hypothetical protein
MPSDFLLAYRQLINIASNDPDNLAARAKADSRLQTACEKVEKAAFSIFIAERYSDTRFAHDIPKAEIEAINDYDNRWRRAVGETNPFMRDILRMTKKPPARDPDRERIADAIEEGEHLSSKFEALIDHARDHTTDDPDTEFWEWAFDALSVWDGLRTRTQFNLRDILARLELVPFVRIPSEVSRAHGSAEAVSLFQRLHDAQQAFVFGCYLSCAAMQRAILEDILPPGDKVPRRIDNANLTLPVKKRLHEISLFARDVLHADRRNQVQGLQRAEMILKLVRGLRTLKELIEAGPIERGANQ